MGSSFPRHVRAIGVRFERIAGQRVGPRTAAAAEVAILANTAAALEAVGIAQCAERGMVLIDFDDRILGKPPAPKREETGGEDLARVADEHDPLAVADPQRRPMSTPGGRVVFALGAGQRIAAELEHETSVVRGLGRFDAIRLRARVVPEPREGRFVFLRRDPLFLDATSHGNQKEDRPIQKQFYE